jgi:hypothetical protein
LCHYLFVFCIILSSHFVGEFLPGSYRHRYHGIWHYKHCIVGAEVLESERAQLLEELQQDRRRYVKNWDDVLKNEALASMKFAKLMNRYAVNDRVFVLYSEEINHFFFFFFLLYLVSDA